MDVGPFLQLVTEDKIPQVVAGIEAAVIASFAVDADRSNIVMASGRRITSAEMKRRVEMCAEMFREVRGELKWSVARITDHLPDMLRKRLDGEEWRPEENGPAHWAPSLDGQQPHRVG